jgi:hypothetical protein
VLKAAEEKITEYEIGERIGWEVGKKMDWGLKWGAAVSGIVEHIIYKKEYDCTTTIQSTS